MQHYNTMIFCDFDGTITTEETFVGALKRLAPEELLLAWFGKMQRGEMTLRACTETIFSQIPSARYPLVEEYASTVRIREGFTEFLDLAAQKGIPVVVISGGIRAMQEKILAPYMPKLLDFFSCDVDLGGEYMRFASEYGSETENVGKEKIMALYSYDRAICIGDQLTDIRMAEHSDEVFARDFLAEKLQQDGRAFHAWEDFYDISKVLKTM